MTSNPDHDKIAKSTGIVSSATFLSRILGLVREQVFAYLFGAGFTTDAFIAAFRIPNLLRDLFAEGALSSAFISGFHRLPDKSRKGESMGAGESNFEFTLNYSMRDCDFWSRLCTVSGSTDRPRI